MRRKPFIVVGTGILSAALVLLGAGAAFAIPDPGAPDNQADIPSDVEIASFQFGDTVRGNIGEIPDGTPYPTGEADGVDRGPALIRLRDVNDPNGTPNFAYCVNLTTSTSIGIRYSASDWTTGGVANSSYITFILTHYFPFIASAPGGTIDQQIAAVQSAIWYFSDGWVLTADDPARNATAAIVAEALEFGGNTPPPPAPTLALAPSTLSAPSDVPAAGPFTVTGNATGATVQEIFGLDLYLDAARTVPAPVGTPVAEGTPLWAGNVSELLPPASFTIGAQYEVPVGTLYLADPDPDGHQKIVLAQTGTLPVRATASVAVYPANAVTVVKSIGGAAAGRQGEVTLEVNCTPGPAEGTQTVFRLPAGSAAGSYTFTVTGVPVDASCSVVETANGASTTATLTSTSITPASVTIPAVGEAAPAITVANLYATPVTPVKPILPATGAEDRTTTAIVGGAAVLGGLAMVLIRRRMVRRND